MIKLILSSIRIKALYQQIIQQQQNKIKQEEQSLDDSKPQPQPKSPVAACNTINEQNEEKEEVITKTENSSSNDVTAQENTTQPSTTPMPSNPSQCEHKNQLKRTISQVLDDQDQSINVNTTNTTDNEESGHQAHTDTKVQKLDV